MKLKNIKSPLALFIGWALAFFVLYLCLPHIYEDRYLVSDGGQCQSVSWDTGYGFNKFQSAECKPEEFPHTPELVLLKTFNRHTDVQKIRVTGDKTSRYWFANKSEKFELFGDASAYEQEYSVGSLKFAEIDRPSLSYWFLLAGIFILSALFTWTSRELIWYSRTIKNKRAWSLLGVLGVVGVATFGVMWVCYPGMWNPFDSSGALQQFSRYELARNLLSPYYLLHFSMVEVFGRPWTLTIFLIASIFTIMIWIARRLYELAVPGWTLIIANVLVLFLPATIALNLFLEKNMTATWLNILFINFFFFSVFTKKKPQLFFLFVIAMGAVSIQASSVLFFPTMCLVIMIRYRTYWLPGLYAFGFLFLVTVVWPNFDRIFYENGLEFEYYERISLYRHVTDLQYDCDFPRELFSKETEDVIDMPMVRERVKNCESRPCILQLDTDTHRVSTIRRELFNATLKVPDIVLSARVRLFVAILGSDRRPTTTWDLFSRMDEYRGSAADFGFLRDNRGEWQRSFAENVDRYSIYPYRSLFLSLAIVIGTLFLWSVFPMTAAVALVFTSKICIVFFMAPIEEAFYLYDIYILGFILPLMMYAEGKRRGYRLFSRINSST